MALNPQELYDTALISDGNIEAYYRFVTGLPSADSSGNSNTLTHVNSPVHVSGGKFGYGLDYELSSSQYSYAADSASLDITGDHTIGFWIKIEQLPSTAGSDFNPVTKWISTTGNRSYFCRINSSDIFDMRYSGSGSDQTQVITSSAIVVSGDVGNYVFIVYTVDVSSQTFVCYKNGESVSLGTVSGTNTSVYNSGTSLGIGAREIGGTPAGFVDGILDDVFIFSRILTAEEISNLYDLKKSSFFLMF